MTLLLALVGSVVGRPVANALGTGDIWHEHAGTEDSPQRKLAPGSGQTPSHRVAACLPADVPVSDAPED